MKIKIDLVACEGIDCNSPADFPTIRHKCSRLCVVIMAVMKAAHRMTVSVEI